MKSLRNGSKGFTLTEVMIVVIIIGVLAGIALPAYQRHVVSTRRAAASACLMEMSQFMERYYTTNLTYVGGNPTGMGCQGELTPFYTFALAAAATASAYTVQATPIGIQATRDTTCGVIGINQAGTKSEGGSATAATECW